jgi:hypothetical protein
MRSDDYVFLYAWDVEMTGDVGVGDRPPVPSNQRSRTYFVKVRSDLQDGNDSLLDAYLRNS